MWPTRYRIVVEEELAPRYADAFDGLDVCAANGQTTICGSITDASHLQGVLERIASLGLTLTSVAQLDDRGASP